MSLDSFPFTSFFSPPYHLQQVVVKLYPRPNWTFILPPPRPLLSRLQRYWALRLNAFRGFLNLSPRSHRVSIRLEPVSSRSLTFTPPFGNFPSGPVSVASFGSSPPSLPPFFSPWVLRRLRCGPEEFYIPVSPPSPPFPADLIFPFFFFPLASRQPRSLLSPSPSRATATKRRGEIVLLCAGPPS